MELDPKLTISAIANIIVGLAACVSIIVAIFVYLRQAKLQRELSDAQEKQQRELSKLQHTYQMVGLIFQDGPVAHARMCVSRWIAEGHEFPNDEIGDDEDRTIIMILDYYEYLCEGVFREVFHGDYVNREHGYRIERTFYLLQNYLAARENRLKKFTGKYGYDDNYELNSAIKKFLRDFRKKEPERDHRFYETAT